MAPSKSVAGRKKIDTLLERQRRPSSLGRLLGQAKRRQALTEQLRALLPPDVREQCSVGNVLDHVLTVHTSTAAWATRIRFLINTLLPDLRRLSDFSRIEDVKVSVVAGAFSASEPPAGTADEHASRLPRQPPDAESLAALAEQLDYDDLKSALLRLARHGNARRDAHK